MNDNLKKAIELMLFMSDQPTPDTDEIEKIVKKPNWFQKYTWTAKTEERYIMYLGNMLKKEWQGISRYKPLNIKERDKIAKEFVFNYGLKTRQLKKEDFIQVVPYVQLEDNMTKQELDNFWKWMFGQTTPLYGVYRWDLERWLRYKCDPKNEKITEWD